MRNQYMCLSSYILQKTVSWISEKIQNSQHMAIREKHTNDGASCADSHQNLKGLIPFQKQSLSNSNVFSPTQ